MVKNPPVMQKTQVRPLGQEDPLEKGMDTHSSILALRIPWTEEPGGLQSMGSQTAGQDRETKHTHTPLLVTLSNPGTRDLFCFTVDLLRFS